MIDRTKEEIQKFYMTHSNIETAEFLGISKSQMLRVLDKLQIEKKVPFKKHVAVKDTLEELKSRINISNFCEDCSKLTQAQLCEKYNITIRQIKYLKEEFNIKSRLKRLSDYNIDSKIFEDYYKQHTLSATAKYFELSNSTSVKNLLKLYNIIPEKRLNETLSEAANRIDKTDLEDFYKIHTLQETGSYFNCKLIPQLLKYYNIETKTKKHETFDDIILRINQEDFISDFNNLNIYELFKKYNITYTMYRKLIDYYNLGYKTGIFAFQDASLSTCEDNLYEFLCTLVNKDKIIRHDRNLLSGQEVDFYIPDKKLAIEFNGNY